MGVRWYDPEMGRFTSADSIVPSAGKPQALNRYAYVYNAPLRYTDPTGHCPQGDADCWAIVAQLWDTYRWSMDSQITWTLAQVQNVLADARAIELWFDRNGGNGLQRMGGALAGVHYSQDSLSHLGTSHVWGSTIYLAQLASVSNIVHEIGHVLDNRSAAFRIGSVDILAMIGGAAIWGGGAGDAMAAAVGGNAGACTMRFSCRHYRSSVEDPTDYGQRGPSEDFAETFMYAVVNPQFLEARAPTRAHWMAEFASLQVNVGSSRFAPPRTRIYTPGVPALYTSAWR
jgi:hypothetical protein